MGDADSTIVWDGVGDFDTSDGELDSDVCWVGDGDRDAVLLSEMEGVGEMVGV